MPVAACNRCEGTGTVDYQYGQPGTDRHTPASEIVWREAVTKTCPVCHGEGTRYVRPITRTGYVYLLPSGEIDHEKTVNEAHRRSTSKGNQGWIK